MPLLLSSLTVPASGLPIAKLKHPDDTVCVLMCTDVQQLRL